MKSDIHIPFLPSARYGWRDAARDLPLILLFSNLIAGGLTIVTGWPFQTMAFISNVAGVLTVLQIIIGFRLFRTPWEKARRLFLCSAVVAAIAAPLFSNLLFGNVLSAWSQAWMILIGVGINTGGAAFFYKSNQIRFVENELRSEQLAHAENRQQLLSAHLKMLQAQIEPHFLFNSLANVRALIDDEPGIAKDMLDHMNDYLRATLVRTRKDMATISDELEMLHHYLSIMQLRMVSRLDFQITLPPGLASHPLPPLLVQPLVENAIKHGLEPKVDGGRLVILASSQGDRLIIQISDTGLGLVGGTNTASIGISNVRQRLQALYGNRARLTVENGVTEGVVATLEIPLEEAII